MPISFDTAGEYTFNYSDALTPAENFSHWYNLNQAEREAFGEKPLSLEESKVIFCKLFDVNLVDKS